jgi:hypothetical protein
VRTKENIFATTLRINMETPEGSQAVTWLKSRDKKEYPSYSDLITEAVNFFCARRLALENDPYLETRQKEDRFLRQMEERIEQAIWQAEARGFANAMQMMQAGLAPTADTMTRPTPTNVMPQKDSTKDGTLDEESLDIAMDFIDSL